MSEDSPMLDLTIQPRNKRRHSSPLPAEAPATKGVVSAEASRSKRPRREGTYTGALAMPLQLSREPTIAAESDQEEDLGDANPGWRKADAWRLPESFLTRKEVQGILVCRVLSFQGFGTDMSQRTTRTHFALLADAYGLNAVAKPPTADVKARFAALFTGLGEDLDARLRVLEGQKIMAGHSEFAHGKTAAVRNACEALKSHSNLAGDIWRMNPVYVTQIFSECAKFGFSTWAPDVVAQNPTSPYNLVHERIFISTLRSAGLSGAYDACGPLVSAFQDQELLSKLYRHHVFATVRTKTWAEQARQGFVAERNEAANVIKRRNRVRPSVLQTLFVLISFSASGQAGQAPR